MRPSAGRPELWDGSQGNKPPLSKTPGLGGRGGRRFRWELRTAPQKMGRQQRTVCVCAVREELIIEKKNLRTKATTVPQWVREGEGKGTGVEGTSWEHAEI